MFYLIFTVSSDVDEHPLCTSIDMKIVRFIGRHLVQNVKYHASIQHHVEAVVHFGSIPLQ